MWDNSQTLHSVGMMNHILREYLTALALFVLDGYRRSRYMIISLPTVIGNSDQFLVRALVFTSAQVYA